MSVRLSGPPPQAGGARLDSRLLRTRAQCVLRSLACAGSELSLSLADDDEIAELNRRYRGIAAPTDVLSFSLLEGDCAEHRGRLLGDVVIGIETAAHQARERHRGLDEQVARLLIHGVLHLLGHDHEEPDAARVMRAEERRLWRALQA
jgi:probable rRNA maturation factor